jgi:uncharacterized protein (TIGR03435 family)
MFAGAKTVLSFLLSVPAFSQSEPGQLSFEVADVKVNKSGEARMAVDMRGGGKFTMLNVPMKVMVMFAYHMRPDAVTGGPGWLESDRFDIVAKAAPATPPDDLRRMLQNLLAERFKLVIHEEPKIMQAYALVVGKSGPKLQASEAALLTEQRCMLGEGAVGQKHINCRHMTMAALADQLQEQSPRDFDVVVVDQTGLSGAFDFKLDWTPAERTAAPAIDPAAGPTVFEAVGEQLGLRLESRKLPLPVIVIDRVERVPVEN